MDDILLVVECAPDGAVISTTTAHYTGTVWHMHIDYTDGSPRNCRLATDNELAVIAEHVAEAAAQEAPPA